MKRALFIVDDRPEAGRGHVVRSGALAAELERRGWRTETIGWGEDCGHISGTSDVQIYDLREDVQESSNYYEASDVVIDDTAAHRFPDAGIVVNGGAGANDDMYRESGADLVLAGPTYALLRPEFRDVAWSLDSANANSITMFDARQAQGFDAGHMAHRMRRTLLTITAGGMRAMEAACVGAPMILFIESPDQEMNAQALQRKCAGVIARDEEYAQRLAKELLRDPDWLARMSAAGRRLVDGLGCKRVADAIEALV